MRLAARHDYLLIVRGILRTARVIVHWKAFAVTVAIITIVPGPDTMLVVRSALLRGRAAAVLTALGCSLGLTVWSGSAALGSVAILRWSPRVFATLQRAGAVYLIALGAVAVIGRLRRPGSARGREASNTSDGCLEPHAWHSDSRSVRWRAAIVQGVIADLLNPKAAAFFTALVPQFVTVGASHLGRAHVEASFGLGLLAAVIAFLGLAAYGLLAANARAFLRRPSAIGLVDLIAGLTLAAVGVAMLLRTD